MRLSAYPAFTATAFTSRLAYRNQVWAGVFGELVGTFAFIAVWTAAYAGAGRVEGVSLAEMVTYVVIAGPLLHWNSSRFIHEIGNAVRSGDVTVYLLKPLHYPGMLLFNQLGSSIFEHLTTTLPVAIIVALAVGLLPPASLAHGAMFVAFWAVSWGMMFCIATLTGLLAFWILTAFSLDWFLRGIMAVASGAIVPLWFMPAGLAAILGKLPFAWVSFYPTAVYLGKLDLAAAGLHLAIGLIWLAILGALLAWLWSAARSLIVQGG